MLRLPKITANYHFYTRVIVLLICLNNNFVVNQWLSYEDVSKRLTTRCEFGEYDCILGDKCISLVKFRDGVVDCLDGSDEFCYPGQFKCGSICVELQFLGECLANPTCNNSLILPSYCDLIKPKLCRFDDAVPCKGYGECVLRKWLMDGNKDCFDGSDEDPNYSSPWIEGKITPGNGETETTSEFGWKVYPPHPTKLGESKEQTETSEMSKTGGYSKFTTIKSSESTYGESFTKSGSEASSQTTQTKSKTKNLQVETWSPFDGEKMSTLSNVPTEKGENAGQSWTYQPTDFKPEQATGKPDIPHIPFIPVPPNIFPTSGTSKTPGIDGTRPTTSSTEHFSISDGKKTTHPISSSSHSTTSQRTSTASTTITIDEQHSERVISDPYQFPLGIDGKFTTSAPGNLNCSEKMKQAANELVPKPMCDCPVGQMRNLQNQCVQSEISTFRARLMHICGSSTKNIANEAQILTWKLASTFNYPICVRKAEDMIVFNTVCNGCKFNDLIDQYAMNSDLPELDIKLSELPHAACYEFALNDCDEKAECIPKGLRYTCKCLPGTHGNGRVCDGVVIANQCTKLLGVCILFWVLLLLLLAVLIPIISYFIYKCCKKRNVKIFDRFQKKKKRVEIATTVQSGNIEAGNSNSEQQENFGSTQWDKPLPQSGRASIPTITTSTPRATPLNQILPADEYCIIENEDDEEVASSKEDIASVHTSTDSAIVLTKPPPSPPATSDVAVHSADEMGRRPSTSSRSATPTIWESYKILGQQYARFGTGQRRRSSTNSLELLIKKKKEGDMRKAVTVLSLPDVNMEMNTALPPLPTVSFSSSLLDRADSKRSIGSVKSEHSTKLAEMLGVASSSIPEETAEDAAEESEGITMTVDSNQPTVPETLPERGTSIAETSKIIDQPLPFILSSMPSTPEIQKVAETTVTDALRNVIGPQYDSQVTELQVSDRLQTTTKASPIGSVENLPVIGDNVTVNAPDFTPESTEMKQEVKPGSGTSNKSRTTLPSPTIESDIAETSAKLDAVAEALSQLPPIPVPALPKFDDQKSSNTMPSTARTKRPMSPKTARSLTSEKSVRISSTVSGSPSNSRKTISSSMKEKPPLEKRRTTSSIRKKPLAVSLSSTSEGKTTKTAPTTTKSSPGTQRKTIKSAEIIKPVTTTKKLPPIYQKTTSMSTLKPKKDSPTRQLSNISEKSENVQQNVDIPTQIQPISLPSTARDIKTTSSIRRPTSTKGSKLPQLTDPQKAKSKVFCQCDEPEYMIADLDLDLPGPYMLPASSIEDLKTIGASRLPRLKNTNYSASAPSSQRYLPKKSSVFDRQFSTKSDEVWKSRKLPPIDVDLDDAGNMDLDMDFEQPIKRSTSSTIARKIASRKAAGHDYVSKPERKTTASNLDQVVYEYRHPSPYETHIHDGCLKNQPPWDMTSLKEGEIEQIPLDWNISRSNSLMSVHDRQTQSQGDLRQITSIKIYDIPIKTDTSKKSSSLTNLFHFKAKLFDVDTNLIDSLKDSLKKKNNWLDYD
uniref:EGF-like domain-containing protein n=1 Tax=Panagrolaimus sp. JU765 TaxID=591449 RepID=A0AC34R7B6_9BILA